MQMMKTVNAGNLIIGEGMPKIAVPVVAANTEEAKAQGDIIMRSPADLVELRVDYFDDIRDADAVSGLVSAMKETVPGRPFLFTVRTVEEGGLAELTASEYTAVCCAGIETGQIDLIDIEYSMGGEVVSAIRECAGKHGVATVFSCHDFQGTPAADLIKETIHSMAEAGADIAKMAVMPEEDGDTLTLLQASAALKKELEIPFILIAMGEKGMISRVGGEVFGSAVTFAQTGIASAPGQMNADDLDRMLRVLHRYAAHDEIPAEEERINSGGQNISIIGFMGTGKSTISAELSRMTGMQAVEIDDMLAEEAGMSIPDIFDRFGESHFRNLEEAICAKATAGEPSVISCGGGTPMREANVKRLKEAGVIILLEASPDTVYERVSRTTGDRPMLAQYMSRGYISWLMKQRETAYRRAADAVISVDGKTAAEIAQEILQLAGGPDCS